MKAANNMNNQITKSKLLTAMALTAMWSLSLDLSRIMVMLLLLISFVN